MQHTIVQLVYTIGETHVLRNQNGTWLKFVPVSVGRDSALLSCTVVCGHCSVVCVMGVLVAKGLSTSSQCLASVPA